VEKANSAKALPVAGFRGILNRELNPQECNILSLRATNPVTFQPKPLHLSNEVTIQDQFLQLVKEHSGMIHKVCRLYGHAETDRQDLFQEIIIQLWKSFPRFRGDSKFSTWLYRIALNTAISDLRKQKRQIDIVYSDLPVKDLEETEVDREKEEQLKQLYTAIGQLGEIEKAIVMLYLEDKSYEEMEDILGINQNNLRVKMNRIKEKLRKLTKEVEHGVG